MDIVSLDKKREHFWKVKNALNEELKPWEQRAKEMAKFFQLENNSLQFIDGKYTMADFSYRYNDRIKMEINSEEVRIDIYDFEDDHMGRAIIKTEDFVSDDWEKKITDFIKDVKKEKLLFIEQQKRESDIKELERLKALYPDVVTERQE